MLWNVVLAALQSCENFFILLDMVTNLDRLHKVAQDKITGRGAGKTTFAVQELAAALELKQVKNIFIVISKYHDISYIRPMINRIFQEHCLEFRVKSQSEFEANGIRCEFVTEDDYSQKIRGYHNFGLIYMRRWD